MKLTTRLKLQTPPEDHAALLATLERANVAANAISEMAWQSHTFAAYRLHKVCYRDIRARFDLSAQVVVRLIAKVADAYEPDRKVRRFFRPHGSIAYDDRILRYDPESVSIWTVTGRRTLPFVCDKRTRRLLASQQGESDLVYCDGAWYIHATVDLTEPPGADVEDVLGVDLGVVNLAVDSDGHRHSGAHVNRLRQRHRRIRARLKRKFTSSAAPGSTPGRSPNLARSSSIQLGRQACG